VSITGDLLETMVNAKTDKNMRELQVEAVLLTFFRSFLSLADVSVKSNFGYVKRVYAANDECDKRVKRLFSVINLLFEPEGDQSVGDLARVCMPNEKEIVDPLVRIKAVFKLFKVFVDADVDFDKFAGTSATTRVNGILNDEKSNLGTVSSQARALSKS